MRWVTGAALAMVLAAGALALARLLRRGSLADRVVAADTFVTILVGGIAVYAARTATGVFLVAVTVPTLLGFVATVTLARFIERRGT